MATNYGPTSPFYSNIEKSDLVLWLDAFDNSSYPGSGTTWTDMSGNGNNATLNTATIGTVSSSLSEGVMAFDGATNSNSASISDSSDFHYSTGNFTIEMWVQRPTGASSGTIYHQYVDDTNFQQIFYHSNNLLYLYNRVSGTATPYLNTGSALALDTWHHIVFVRYGTGTNNMYVYADTVSQTITWNNALASGADIPNIAAPVWFGKTDPYGYGTWGGYYSSIRIYKGRALSAAEVSQHYNVERSRFGV